MNNIYSDDPHGEHLDLQKDRGTENNLQVHVTQPLEPTVN